MPREGAYTLEEFGMLMKDLYKPTQLYWLHQYDSATDEELAKLDSDFLKTRSASLSEEMQYLLNSKKETIRPPLPNPILPKRIIENGKNTSPQIPLKILILNLLKTLIK